MKTFTPGPWRTDFNPYDKQWRVYQQGGNNCPIINSLFKPYDEEGLANARLIAAAPELLRELKSAIFYIETYGGEVTHSFSAGGNMDAVKAVIARAEGRTQQE